MFLGLPSLYAAAFWAQGILHRSSDATQEPTPSSSSPHPVYTLPADSDVGAPLLANIKDPEAVDAQVVCPGYIASNVRELDNRKLTAYLDLAGKPCNVYGNDVANLTLSVEYQADDRLSVRIQPRYVSPENETWFLLPEELIPRPAAEADATKDSNALKFFWTNDGGTFSFTVSRKDTGDTIFSTVDTKLIYEDQFVEFVSWLPQGYNLYGLGETMHSFRLGNNVTRTLYATDISNSPDVDSYGVHPVYLETRYYTPNDEGGLIPVGNKPDPSVSYTSFSHGVYQRNAHAQEVLLRENNATWRALGGSIDLIFYSGRKPVDVIRSYQLSAVGLPAMQQYWTFGFHQCRWGYRNWTHLQEILDNFEKFEIPLETIWTDIDYMKKYRDFENDPIQFNYSDAAKFLARLHSKGQHYVPIVDSAIYAPNPEDTNDAYEVFNRGVDANAFMMNPNGSLYIGAVWPGYTVFPDWIGATLNGTGAFDWWSHEMALWQKNIPFDGIWIDMSEVSSFCVGSCGSGKLSLNPAHVPFALPGEPGNADFRYPEGFERTNASEASSASSASSSQAQATKTSTTSSSAEVVATTTSYLRTKPTPGARNINHPPYVINHFHGDLAVHAVSPNATHHGGQLEYDFHNLFGHQILNATRNALLAIYPGKRPFIIGRSTFAGTGKWAGHWGGDNESLWSHLVASISQALVMALSGIPMFGPDTCGFGGNTDLELCSRWMQLSAFFPFYRNHNIIGAISQEPYVWEAVTIASKKAMEIRYQLLPYMYTLFARANQEGSTVMRALAWEFPDEPWLADADLQFMLGDALMVTPCLTQGASTVDGMFPGVGSFYDTVWYDWYNHTAVEGIQRGQNVTIDAPLGHIPLYLRGGTVVPLQEAGMTTAACRKTPWSLLVSLNKQGVANGELYLDDGESLVPSQSTWVQFSVSDQHLLVDPKGNYVDSNPLANVTILGVSQAPNEVSLNGTALDSSKWSYAEESSVLSLTGLSEHFLGGAWTSRWDIKWS